MNERGGPGESLDRPQEAWAEEIAACKNQREAAIVYATALPQREAVDWSALNRAILARWSMAGLERVKALAWKMRADGFPSRIVEGVSEGCP